MLNIRHKVILEGQGLKGRAERFLKMKRLLDAKNAAYLRLLATKNNINRASDYHYLNLAVTQSTEPVNGIDYIHPVVKPAVDYATAVVLKGICPNGEIQFEFVPDSEEDAVAARQATDMVSYVLNQQNDPHQIMHHWVMDAALHKNGEMMIAPVRENITRYVTTKGTLDQLKAFEAQAESGGLTVTKTSRKKIDVDMAQVVKEIQQELPEHQQAMAASGHDNMLDHLNSQVTSADVSEVEDLTTPEEMTQAGLEGEQTLLDQAMARNTIYEATYKLVGYQLAVKFRPIAQHYWMCDPTVITIQEQPYCGFYEPMSIQEATELYPGIDLEQFEIHAEYSNVGAYQAGSLLNNLALHARDSVPINGLPSMGTASQDKDSRQVTVITVWNRYDIDDDGELELIELIYSGNYIISAREVEFIPVANMCPKPLAQNFYGMSIAESVVPMQEYSTAGHRAEIQLGLLTATPRLGVKPDKLDFEMLQDGEAAIFILDSKFDPAKDIYPVPPPQGNLAFIDVALGRIQNDVMAMIGMTQAQDVFNPEVMAPGNSGAKLQLALSPNQLMQDDTIKNCAEGVRQAIWLVWRTLIQYADDYGVKKLAQKFHPDKKPEFLDALGFDDMNFHDRHHVHINLAMGMKSEENQVQRQQIIVQAQTQLYKTVTDMTQAGTMNPEMYKKVKKPYADTLYALGVKDCDAYLPTEAEVVEMIAGAAEAKKNAQPSPEDQARLAKAGYDEAKTKEVMSNIEGTSADKQLELMNVAQGKTAAGIS
jgi:hypothetical protein